MPRLTRKYPDYRLHKRSGQAVVTLDGLTYYLGPHGSPESRAEYDRLIAECDPDRIDQAVAIRADRRER
jgi:hypothetical protein